MVDNILLAHRDQCGGGSIRTVHLPARLGIEGITDFTVNFQP